MTTKKFEKANKSARAVASAHNDSNSVSIAQPKSFTVFLEIQGTAPLIQNAFSQKAIEQMLRKHMGFRVDREKKNPRQCIEDATIRNMKGHVCVPPTAIKKAMLSAVSGDKNLKKTQTRIALFVMGQSVPLKFSEMQPRMDMVRTSGMSRTPDVRFRPMFTDWSARVGIEFSESLPVQTVVDLLNRAGSIGIGEWRPEKDGTFGTFVVTRHISDPKECREVEQSCAVPLVPITIPDWAIDTDIDPEVLAKIARGGGVAAEEEAAE